MKAREKVDEMRSTGDVEGADTWLRIIVAIGTWARRRRTRGISGLRRAVKLRSSAMAHEARIDAATTPRSFGPFPSNLDAQRPVHYPNVGHAPVREAKKHNV